MALPSFRLIVLFFLYSLEGVPYGLQSRFLPLVLRESGSSLSSLGLYKLLYLPWIFKSAYAPLVDSYGSRRWWLKASIIGLVSCTAFLSMISDTQLATSVVSLPLCLLIFNGCAATLDIAVDSIAIDLLSDSELGYGNTAQVVGYKFGAVIGGGLLSWFTSFSLSFLFIILCGFYAFGLFVASTYEGFDVCEKTKDIQHSTACDREEVRNYFRVLLKAIFTSPSTPSLVFLLLVYKLGEMGAMNMLPLMLLDHGMPLSVVLFWTGVVGQVSSIVGSSSAAAIMGYFGRPVDVLQPLFLLRIGTLSLLTAFVFYINFVSHWLGVMLMNATLIVSGAITTTVFTLMMECTRCEVSEGARATHYTVLSTVEMLGKLIFAAFGAATLTEALGYPFAYLVFLALNFLPPALLASGRHHWPFLKP